MVHVAEDTLFRRQRPNCRLLLLKLLYIPRADGAPLDRLPTSDPQIGERIGNRDPSRDMSRELVVSPSRNYRSSEKASG